MYQNTTKKPLHLGFLKYAVPNIIMLTSVTIAMVICFSSKRKNNKFYFLNKDCFLYNILLKFKITKIKTNAIYKQEKI